MSPNTLLMLFSELKIRNLTLKNRIFSTGHQVAMNNDGLPTDRFIAYQAAKAKGGAGLVITESSRVHASSHQPGWVLDVSDDRCLGQLTKLAGEVKRHGAAIFGQLGHPGALCARSLDSIRREVYSASAMRDFRYRNVARPLSVDQIKEIVQGYADAAARYQKAGFDGVEVMASHGVLPAQFLNPHLNKRTDDYGGSFENRLRFFKEVLNAIRNKVGDEFVIGTRLSIDEYEELGLTSEDTIPACQVLDQENLVDFLNVTGGTMSSAHAATHIVPPMGMDVSYLNEATVSLKKLVTKPVFYAGRINQPQMAEQLLQDGVLDLCGMTRAMIADPNMANKAAAGKLDDIVACIGCNQACIGHLHQLAPISCIQNPSTGREAVEANIRPVAQPKHVVVIGAGPAGMKAAVVAAQRGHVVSLYERDAQLGGQAWFAQMLPSREEFAGLITNLERQLEIHGVNIHLNTNVSKETIKAANPDHVILSTGATPYLPDPENFEDADVVHAQDLVTGKASSGTRVVIFDWRGDWIALGLAEKLALDGCTVRIVTEAPMIGEAIPAYVRDQMLGRCHKLGVQYTTHTRFFGASEDTCYFTHTLSGEPIIMDEIDTMALSTGHSPNVALEHDLIESGIPFDLIGDCLTPRSAEEAIYEGWLAGLSIL